MTTPENLKEFDPFADTEEGVEGASKGNRVHIRIHQRNRRKCLTTVSGLDYRLDLKKILKACKKSFNCNGVVVVDKEFGDVIQLQGDQRENISSFLQEAGIVAKASIKVHGF